MYSRSICCAQAYLQVDCSDNNVQQTIQNKSKALLKELQVLRNYTVKKWIMGFVIFIKKIKVIIKNSEYISLKKLWFSVV